MRLGHRAAMPLLLVIVACHGAGGDFGPRTPASSEVERTEPTNAIATTTTTTTAISTATTAAADPPVFESAFAAYQWLENRTGGGDRKIDHRVDQAIDLVFVDPDEHGEAVRLAARILDGEDLTADLYELVMRAEPNPEVLIGYLDEAVDEVFAEAEQSDTRRGAFYAWRGSYLLDAALTAYEATGDTRFIELARDAMLVVLENRDDVHDRMDEYRGRVLKAWGTDHLLEDGRFTNVVTHAGRIVAPMAWYAWIVAGDVALQPRHGETAAVLLEAAQDALTEFDAEFVVAENGTYGYYWRTISEKIEALNHQTSVGEALLYIAELVDEPSWDVRVRRLTAFVRKATFHESNGTFAWRYRPTPDDPRSPPLEAIWKAHVTIRFMLHAERLDAGFDAGDIEAVAESVRINVLRDGGQFNSVLAEEFRPLNHGTDGAGLAELGPFIILEEWHPELGAELLDLIATTPAMGGWFHQSAIVVGYASRLR